MPNKDLTYITIVLDKSGSMQTIQADTEGGFNAFIEQQAKEPGQALVSLHQFDTIHTQTFSHRPINEVPPLKLSPGGGTALLDAVARAINATQDHIEKLPQEERPASVVLVILTDGQENSSREFTQAQVKKLIEHQRDGHGWLIQYLGADVEAIDIAQGIGIDFRHALRYTGQNVNSVMASASASSSLYRGSVAQGNDVIAAVLDSAFTQEDREEAVKPSTK